ncbi:c-type cytochrome [Erythrobacter dokdonensis]|uniref:Cytochrome c family protein n=1 Tax=Erythrobacter dokdonensis DSW-74 TaxID=1300349 RepID=A0A1A7BHW1_9SPHN|nr:c-type cytochrome [Erythrobacter dokdonensis]OBV12069.1 Cytochrome c family protein [Erythrobacter dokdonensis DSW-74]
MAKVGSLRRVLFGLALAWTASGCSQQDEQQGSTPPGPAASAPDQAFAPPALDSIPEGPEGDAIRRGRDIFLNTGTAARPYVGSGLTCGNCHLDEGRKPDASPMWAAWGMYPAYRAKNDRINTMEDRIRGCFVYSMNAQASPAGVPPPYGDDIYRDLEIYFAWLAKGVQVGTQMPRRGFPSLPEPELAPDPARGRIVYEEQCSACHQPGGEGVRNDDGTYLYPPLWGDHSFNWGAGMSRTKDAAGFIKANMPFGQDNSLSDQQAWDVAAFVTTRERPRDPRQTGSIEEARQRFHAKGDYYGQTVDGNLLGDGK